MFTIKKLKLINTDRHFNALSLTFLIAAGFKVATSLLMFALQLVEVTWLPYDFKLPRKYKSQVLKSNIKANPSEEFQNFKLE